MMFANKHLSAKKFICCALTAVLIGSGLPIHESKRPVAYAEGISKVILVPAANKSLVTMDASNPEAQKNNAIDIFTYEEIFQIISEELFTDLNTKEWFQEQLGQQEKLTLALYWMEEYEARYAKSQEALAQEVMQCQQEAEQLAEQKRQEEARKKAEEEAKKAEEAKKKAEEAKKKAEEEAKKKAEQEAKKNSTVPDGLVKKQNAAFCMELSTEAREVLYRIVQAEAGDEGTYGQILVANVILNRVLSDEFPNTVKGVVFEKNQFSPVKNGSYNRVVVSASTKAAVDRALAGEDYSKGALYFFARRYTTNKKASWFDNCLTKVLKYGGHEFYK